ncbi:DUF6318 family protein [Rothia nasimurium]|uniref:DUF6318 family protein n=1 Tax=Rothia nasimurium TaxID=85336 RepID=UPI001F1CF75A|nr:DUF6318 family protein [Rothia nasimurium]
MKHTPTRSLTFAAIALLALTGCGAQATGSIPEADASATASVTASSTSVAADATASAAETNYSGGSKAPDGEYRAADEHGPAQNVPKPVAPDGMNVETPEAMEKFITYWNDMRNYAIQTGDTTALKELTSSNYEADLTFIDSVERLYEDGGWIIGLQRELHLNPDLVTSYGDGLYGYGLNVTSENGIINEVTEIKTIDSSEANLQGYEFFFKYSDGEWEAYDGKVVR